MGADAENTSLACVWTSLLATATASPLWTDEHREALGRDLASLVTVTGHVADADTLLLPLGFRRLLTADQDPLTPPSPAPKPRVLVTARFPGPETRPLVPGAVSRAPARFLVPGTRRPRVLGVVRRLPRSWVLVTARPRVAVSRVPGILWPWSLSSWRPWFVG